MSNAASPPAAATNRLLAQLPVHQRNAVHRASQLIYHNVGDTLLHSHTHSNHVFFPIDSVVSVVRPLRDNACIELGLIGSEGMIGLDVIMDAKTQLDDTVVQIPGSTLQLPGDELMKLFSGGGPLQTHLLRFAHAFLGQVSQTAVCNRFHPLLARISKWLLMVQDRSAATQIPRNPRLIAMALGAKESEIEPVLDRIAATGGIRQRRDAIIVERERLETSACECYETLCAAYGRTLAC